jgi:hypothetical protein
LDLKKVSDLLSSESLGDAGRSDSCIVYDNIDFLRLRKNLGDSLFNRRVVRYVKLYDFETFASQFIRVIFISSGNIAHRSEDNMPIASQYFSGASAKPSARSCNQNCF